MEIRKITFDEMLAWLTEKRGQPAYHVMSDTERNESDMIIAIKTAIWELQENYEGMAKKMERRGYKCQ